MIPMSALLLGLMGLVGMVVHRKHMIMMLMCLELVLLGVETYGVYVGYSMHMVDMSLWVLAIMVIAALEIALALAIIIMLYHHGKSIDGDIYAKLGDVSE